MSSRRPAPGASPSPTSPLDRTTPGTGAPDTAPSGEPTPARRTGDGVRVAALTDIAPATLYELLRLRVDVFVVEQKCPYPELDGRDTEPGTRHLWINSGTATGTDAETATGAVDAADGGPVAYLRILEEPDGVARIGRVVVAERARGAGHANHLLQTALSLVGDRVCVLDAQAHLEGYYGRLGFVRSGPRFLEDGIPHVPMRRPPTAR